MLQWDKTLIKTLAEYWDYVIVFFLKSGNKITKKYWNYQVYYRVGGWKTTILQAYIYFKYEAGDSKGVY